MLSQFTNKIQGFSLVQLSALVLAGGLVASAMLPEGEGQSQASRYITTMKRMQKIEDATIRHMAAKEGRRPCPASGEYYPNNAKFGIEDGTAGDCADSGATDGLLTPFDDTNVIAGTVPVNALHLPTEYYFDGWGRPFTYVVDKRITKEEGCVLMNGDGDVEVYPTDGGTMKEKVMWLLVSHGPDGHGSFQPGGSTRANRLDAGGSDQDQHNNAGTSAATVDPPDFDPATFNNEWVKKDTGATYDDILWYSHRTKNRCCVGRRCSVSLAALPQAHRILGEKADSGHMKINIDVDINNDGYNDIAILAYGNVAPCCSDWYSDLYVIYGTADNKANLPNPIRLSTVGTSISGFKINGYNPTRSGNIYTDDINSDGKNDLVFVGNRTNCGNTGMNIILYGGIGDPGYTGSYNFTSFPLNATYAARFSSGGGCIFMKPGDFNNDGYTDIATTKSYANGEAGGIKITYGKAGGWGTSTVTMRPVGACESGYTCTDIAPSSASVGRKWGSVDKNFAVGDFNNDGCSDLLSQSHHTFLNGVEDGYAHLMFGQSIANCSTAADMPASITIDSLASPTGMKFERAVTNADTNSWVDLKDVDNDGYDDALLVYGGVSPVYVIFGHGAPYTTPVTRASINGTIGSDVLTGGDVGDTHATFVEDINGDGILDIVTDDNPFSGQDGLMVRYGQARPWPTTEAYSALNGSNGFRLTYNPSGNDNHFYRFFDFDQDGRKDLVWGESNWPSDTDEGRVNILLAPATGNWPTPMTSADFDYQVISSSPSAQRVGQADLGHSTNVLDVNNDGKMDLFVSAPDNDVDGLTNAGIGYIIWDINGAIETSLDISTSFRF